MGIFTGSKTLEARVAQLQTDLDASAITITSLIAERDEARTSLAAAETSLTEALTSLASETARADAAEATLGTEQTASSNERIALFAVLQIPADQHAAITADNFETSVRAAVETQAQRRAVDIASGQGVPPVATGASSSSNPDDEIAVAYETAAAETDPRKRAALFAAASALVMAGNN